MAAISHLQINHFILIIEVSVLFYVNKSTKCQLSKIVLNATKHLLNFKDLHITALDIVAYNVLLSLEEWNNCLCNGGEKKRKHN